MAEDTAAAAAAMFEDPVTFEIMHNACIMPCGHSFSESTIESWFVINPNCPLCDAGPFSPSHAVPNHPLRHKIHSMRDTIITNSTPSQSQPLPLLSVEDFEEQQAASVLVRAMSSDPLMQHVFSASSVEKKNKAMFWLFERMVEFGKKHGHILAHHHQTSTGTIDGVVILQKHASVIDMMQSGLALAPAKIGFQSTKRLAEMLLKSEKDKDSLMQGKKYWTIVCIGVDVDVQRTGIGKMLMQRVVDDADKTQTSMYVQTSNTKCIPFFTSHGFVLINTSVHSEDNNFPTFYQLVRNHKR